MDETPTPDTPTPEESAFDDLVSEAPESESPAPESESPAPASKNHLIPILLGVIAVLLIAIVVFLVAGGNDGSEVPTASNTGNTDTNTSTTSTGTMGGAATETPFDPATATEVAADLTPEEHVEAYFDAVVAGDYAAAYELLPASKKESYGSLDAFTAQLEGYGITGYNIDSATEEGDEAEVLATATMAGGDFQYLWTFVKVDDVWLVKARTLPGMAQ